ncbi:MAG: co-chaperone DjlA [Gammaproteobacteria bacterium]|nr:co-chaperone DjlA [Gammaproteobacteria bacterium]
MSSIVWDTVPTHCDNRHWCRSIGKNTGTHDEDTLRGWLDGPWWGKLIGAVIGAVAGKGLLGGIVGLIVGHQFDRGLMDRANSDEHDDEHREAPEHQLFYTTFAVMGHIAKSDGRVSEDEIAAASAVMQRWALSPQQINLARRFFNEGKQADFPLAQVLQQFRRAVHDHQVLLTFVTAQLQVMLADNQIHPATRQRTWEVCKALGVSRVEMASIEAGLRGRHGARSIGSIQQAYRQLGVHERASDDDIKIAYRRMMNRYHPDKLVTDVLSEDEREQAKESLERCKDAYEVIKSARGLR